MPVPGTIGIDDVPGGAALEREKRELALGIGQLILDITGIFDLTPISDGANTLLSLARGKWFDALTNAVSMVPYIGDLAKTTKLPRYLQSVRKAIRIAKLDPKWAGALRTLFLKLKKVLDKGYRLAADKLPPSARNQLKELIDELDNFLLIYGFEEILTHECDRYGHNGLSFVDRPDKNQIITVLH